MPQKPHTLSLFAFPNPFNSSVAITAPAGAEIEIYDLLGNPVWNEIIPRSGPAELVWLPDKSIGSGVYLVRAKSGRQSATKKTVYLK